MYIIFFIIFSQYEDNRVQEFTEPDYEKVMLIKEEDLTNTEEWLAEKASKVLKITRMVMSKQDCLSAGVS